MDFCFLLRYRITLQNLFRCEKDKVSQQISRLIRETFHNALDWKTNGWSIAYSIVFTAASPQCEYDTSYSHSKRTKKMEIVFFPIALCTGTMSLTTAQSAIWCSNVDTFFLDRNRPPHHILRQPKRNSNKKKTNIKFFRFNLERSAHLWNHGFINNSTIIILRFWISWFCLNLVVCHKHCTHIRRALRRALVRAETPFFPVSSGFVSGWQLPLVVSWSIAILNVLMHVCVFCQPFDSMHQPIPRRHSDQHYQTRSPCSFRMPLVRCSSAWKSRSSNAWTSVAS